MTDFNAFQMAAIRGQDEIMTCPYNKSHQIMKSRLQYHISKCKKQHLEMEIETCPFNTTHRIPKPELQMHKIECPDRQILERYKYQTTDECPMNSNFVPVYQTSLPLSEENWDDSCLLTYEPTKHIFNKNVIRNNPAVSKSERKLFRQEERRRFDHLGSMTFETDFTNLNNVPNRLPKGLPKGISNLEGSAKLGMGRGLLPWSSVQRVGKSKPV